MPIRPIDIASVAPRSQEASYQQTNSLRHNQHAAEFVEQNFANNVKHDQKRTIESEKNQWKNLDKDGSNGNRYQKKDSQKQKKKDESKDTSTPSLTTIDIKI